MKAFTIEVTSCRNCPYVHQECVWLTKCNHPVVSAVGTGNCMLIYAMNEFEITPSCPMYNKAVEKEK